MPCQWMPHGQTVGHKHSGMGMSLERQDGVRQIEERTEQEENVRLWDNEVICYVKFWIQTKDFIHFWCNLAFSHLGGATLRWKILRKREGAEHFHSVGGVFTFIYANECSHNQTVHKYTHDVRHSLWIISPERFPVSAPPLWSWGVRLLWFLDRLCTTVLRFPS